jgi:hypothetical protein
MFIIHNKYTHLDIYTEGFVEKLKPLSSGEPNIVLTLAYYIIVVGEGGCIAVSPGEL